MSEQLTVAQLERLLVAKRTRLENLIKERDRLQKQLSVVTEKIDAIEGLKADGRKAGKGRKRPRNERTLLEVVVEILGKNKKGLALNDLADRVLETDYKTTSSNFVNTLYQCLYHTETVVCDPETRLYRLVTAE